jgi:hypothetical protein
MNLFWKKLFGSLQSTHSIEQKETGIRQAIQRYTDIKGSDSFKRYLELQNIVQSAPFQSRKKECTSGNIRKMKHYAEWERFTQIDKDKNLKRYLASEASSALKNYLDFKASPEYTRLAIPAEVAKSDALKRYKSFERSAEYQNYLKYHNSFAVKEYTKLREVVATPEFKQEKAFWEDKNRWTKTDEYQLEREYFSLKAREDVQFFEKNVQLSKGQTMRQIIFEENFEDGVLNTAKWYPGLYQGQKLMDKTYSFANEKQANSGESNIVMLGSALSIATRPDRLTARAWTPSKGFSEKEFYYSSAVVNGSQAVNMKGGMISAKIKIAGDKEISHALWLTGKQQTPHINLFYFDGKKLKVGNYWNNNGALGSKEEVISGINPNNYYIYSLEWTATELIWRINNVEVLRSKKGVPQEELFPVFNSFISEKQAGGSGELIIDWIRVYQ